MYADKKMKKSKTTRELLDLKQQDKGRNFNLPFVSFYL